MNGFEMVNATINMPTSVSDELRIIAKDARGMSAQDRDVLRRGAEELELSNRSLALCYAMWLEANQELAAVRDRLPKTAPAIGFYSMSYSTGPQPMGLSPGWQPAKP